MRTDRARSRLVDLLRPSRVPLGFLANERRVASLLRDRGATPIAVPDIARRFADCARVLQKEADVATDVIALFIPGRIEILGKHTDYGGGRSLVCSSGRGLATLVLPGSDRAVSVTDVQYQETARLSVDPDESPRPGDWSNYAVVAARRLARDFGASRGGRILLSSGVPRAAGMSSSSALTVAVSVALMVSNELVSEDRFQQSIDSLESLAQYVGAVESGAAWGSETGTVGVGTLGGSEDHTAILCSEPGRIKLFGYRPVVMIDDLPLPSGFRFVVASSGVRSSKTEDALEAFNALSAAAATIVAIWNAEEGDGLHHLAAITGSSGFSIETATKLLNETSQSHFADGAVAGPLVHPDSARSAGALANRLRHFHLENDEILPAAVDALKARDLERFGLLVDESQRAAEELLKNQVPETSFLARSAREIGAMAASAFGAGFGGSVWAMVEGEKSAAFLSKWSRAYAEVFPRHADASEFFIDDPGLGACSLGL